MIPLSSRVSRISIIANSSSNFLSKQFATMSLDQIRMNSCNQRKLDDADLLALEASFSEDDDMTPRSQLKSSPVKPVNRQFEDIFNQSLSEEDEDEEVIKDIVQKKSSLSNLTRPLFSSQHSSKNNISLAKLSQQIKASNSLQIPNKLEDLEAMFGDEFEDEPSSQQKATNSFAISALETSSPSYHRTETLNPNSKATKADNSTHTVRDIIDSSGPIISSTPLYPNMKIYNDKYVPKEEIKQPQRLTTAQFYSEPKCSIPLIVSNKPQTSHNKEYKTSTPSLQKLLKRPKIGNSELLLLTQRQPLLSRQRDTRGFATIDNDSIYKDSSIKTVQTFSLSSEQKHVENLVKEGKSLFYTGSAGTGKSVLLRSIIKMLQEKYKGQSGAIAVTASTGLAAVNIGGTTLHSFAGIGLGKEPIDQLIKKVKRSRKSAKRWRDVKVLVIDEISMISGELFDKLDHLASSLRRNPAPFGGIQIITCGDFFQLPPVSKEDEGESKFCFESNSWQRSMQLSITLQKVFRQKGDLEFIDMLNDMRLGKVSDKSLQKFRELERELPADEIEAAELYSTRSEVDNANSTRLNRLKTQVHVYNSYDGGSLAKEPQGQRLLQNFMAPETLYLKKGAQVMMIKNLDDSLINGSLGKVLDFIDRDTFLCYEEMRESLDPSTIDVEKKLNKIKNEEEAEQEEAIPHGNNETIEDLEDTIFGFLDDVKTSDPEALENLENKRNLINQLHKSSRNQKLPLVRFLTPDNHSRYILVNPEVWTVDDEHHKPLVSRTQLPLILAWALSIHKSQGQTLPRVRVNLKKVFEKGQAYVAISRAVSREGLQVLNFDPNRVFIHDKVLKFYETLRNVDDFVRNDVKDYMDQEENEYFLDEDESDKEQFYDASDNLITQDDSNDNIVLNRRNYRKQLQTNQTDQVIFGNP